MGSVRVTLLVHDGPNGAEAARAHDLVSGLDPSCSTVLLREGDRSGTARRWWSELARSRPDLVYVVNAASPGLQVAIAHRVRRGVPFVLDTGDLVFEMARSSGVGAGARLPALWAGERAGWRLAHMIVARSSTLADQLRARGHHDVAVIPDVAPDPSPDTAAAAARIRRDLGLDGAFVVGVVGSLVYSPRFDSCYGWDLVRALPLLPDRVRGLVIGDGDGRAWLEREAERLGVRDRVVFCGRIPRADLLPWVAVMDVGLSTQTDNLAGRCRTTGKVPVYMAAGCFVLASRVGEATRILPDSMLVAYHGDHDDGYPARLADRVRELVARPDLLDERAELPALARQRFGRDVAAAGFQAVVARAARPR